MATPRAPKVRIANVESPPLHHLPQKQTKQFHPPPHLPKYPQPPSSPSVPPPSLPLPLKPKPKEDKNTPNPKPTYSYPPPKYGSGPTPCYVCGSGQHPWIFCAKKQRGKCTIYGSIAHPTRICAQRYRPRPEARIHLAQVTLEIHADPLFFMENMPESDVEDKSNVEASEYDGDSDEEVEEATNALCYMACTHLIEIDELSPLEWDHRMSDR